ncbi:MAG: hypothetical protein K0Q87_3127 [Neobacillus sp.]|jgi:uncharacterized protein (TIGR02413 family)|nr:hypothetical protein [Neobacillus sp.]
MTLNILFLSITIKKQQLSMEEAINHERVEKLYEEIKDRQVSIHPFV